MRDARTHTAPVDAQHAGALEEVAAIAMRAGELGFSPSRVALALGFSPRALASIEAAQAGARTRTAPGTTRTVTGVSPIGSPSA